MLRVRLHGAAVKVQRYVNGEENADRGDGGDSEEENDEYDDYDDGGGDEARMTHITITAELTRVNSEFWPGLSAINARNPGT